ncbi:hypothetical protein [Agrobacterium sp. ICMP 6402]|uniref:hypothetical protein n=1 Tax=Agrobacterium sp. ICMP 6402 TaxID=2292443 RepID=UPI001FF05FA5|nr:hypothetical protein [Agrobacterium sp. ICMP 6402]
MQKLRRIGCTPRPSFRMVRGIGKNPLCQGCRRFQHDQDLAAQSRIEALYFRRLQPFKEKLPYTSFIRQLETHDDAPRLLPRPRYYHCQKELKEQKENNRPDRQEECPEITVRCVKLTFYLLVGR